MRASLSAIINEEDRLDAAYRTGNTAIGERIRKYGEEKDAILAVDEAKEKAFEAEIGRRVKLGLMSKEQGEAMKESARLALDTERGATDQAKLKFEIEQRQKELDDARERLSTGADANAFAAAKTAEGGATIRLAGRQSVLESASKAEIDSGFDIPGRARLFSGLPTDTKFKSVDEMQKAIQDAQGTQEYLAETGRINWHSAKAGDGDRAFLNQYLTDYIKGIQDAMHAHRNYTGNLQKEVDVAKEASETAKSHTAIAEDQLKRDEEINRSGQDHIDTLQAQYVIQESRNAQVQQAQRTSRAIAPGRARSVAARHSRAATPGCVHSG